MTVTAAGRPSNISKHTAALFYWWLRPDVTPDNDTTCVHCRRLLLSKHTHTLSLSLTHTLSLSLPLSLSHTHTHFTRTHKPYKTLGEQTKPGSLKWYIQNTENKAKSETKLTASFLEVVEQTAAVLNCSILFELTFGVLWKRTTVQLSYSTTESVPTNTPTLCFSHTDPHFQQQTSSAPNVHRSSEWTWPNVAKGEHRHPFGHRVGSSRIRAGSYRPHTPPVNGHTRPYHYFAPRSLKSAEVATVLPGQRPTPLGVSQNGCAKDRRKVLTRETGPHPALFTLVSAVHLFHLQVKLIIRIHTPKLKHIKLPNSAESTPLRWLFNLCFKTLVTHLQSNVTRVQWLSLLKSREWCSAIISLDIN